MRFLIDEMYSPAVARLLRDAGHEAESVLELVMAGTEDPQVLARAAVHGQVLVTENAVDFVPLLDAWTAAGESVTAVVIALKRPLPGPAGALAHELARRLVDWAESHPEQYPHVHWL